MEETPGQPSSATVRERQRKALGFALLSAAIHFLFAYSILYSLHPHEDAYILFTYAKNLGGSGSLAYYSGGPPAEGATDFLWMLMLAAAVRLGAEVSIAAAALNALGSAAISYCVCYHLLERVRPITFLFAASFSLLIPFFSLTLASHQGFSTQFYAAQGLFIFLILLFAKGRVWFFLPYACLVMGLLRPDGVIIGAAAFFCSLALMERRLLPRYLGHSLVALLAATGYFLWRFVTYGHLLPLPLIVKSASDSFLPGFAANADWFQWAFLLIVLGFAGIVALLRPASRYLLALLPFCALLVALLFAEQTQNVFFRLQAPASMVLLFLVADLLKRLAESNERRVTVLLMPAVFIIFFTVQVLQSAFFVFRLYEEKNYNYYKYVFAYHLAERLDKRPRIALTEAGRLAYWLDPIAIDLVGLNTEETALRGATPDYIEELNADLIMIHHGGLLATDGCDGDDFCVLDKQQLREATPPDWEDLGQSSNRVVQAIYSAITYLNQAPDEWQIYLVRYQGYSHLYAVRRDGVITQQSFVGALRASFSEQGRRSHLEMTQRLARPNH